MDDAELRAWLDDRVAQHRFSGVALVCADGRDIFCYAGGIAERRHRVPITMDTRFAVASVTKVVVAATCLVLVDRGQLDLHRPLIEILPPEHRTAAMTAGHTLHHLLSHTSGLPNYHDDEAQDWGSFTSAWDRVPTYHARRPADLLPLFAHLPADDPPGERFRYADANYILAGLVIEAVTGRAWTEIAHEAVLVPAGLVDTDVPQLDDDPVGLATGYLSSEESPETWRSNMYSVPAGGMPDGGLVTTAADLARLMHALESGALLTPESYAAMTTPHSVRPVVEQYGYGLDLSYTDGRLSIISHDGMDPGVQANLTHYRDIGTAVVVLCNTDRGAWPVTVRLSQGSASPIPGE